MAGISPFFFFKKKVFINWNKLRNRILIPLRIWLDGYVFCVHFLSCHSNNCNLMDYANHRLLALFISWILCLKLGQHVLSLKYNSELCHVTSNELFLFDSFCNLSEIVLYCHNRLKSVIYHFRGNREFGRLRIGK